MQPSIRFLISSVLPSMSHAYLGQRQAAAITTAPPAVILQQNPQCMILSSALSICTSLTSGFTDMAPTKQAECLCYSNTSFLPAPFDNAVKTCADFASTAAPAAFNAIANLQGFCSNAGGGLFTLFLAPLGILDADFSRNLLRTPPFRSHNDNYVDKYSSLQPVRCHTELRQFLHEYNTRLHRFAAEGPGKLPLLFELDLGTSIV